MTALLPAQPAEPVPDERESRLAHATGRERLELLEELTSSHLETDPARAAAFGMEALELLRSVPDVEIEIGILNDLSHANQTLQDYKSARLWAAQAERLARATENEPGLASALIHLGDIRRNLNDSKGALDYFLEASRRFENINDLPGLAYAQNAIGVTYAATSYHSKALEYLMRSYHTYEILGDGSRVAMTLLNMGTVQMKLDESKALKHLHESMDIFAREGMSIASPLRKIGEILMNRGEYEEALQYFQQALQIREKEYENPAAWRRKVSALRLALSLRSVCRAYARTDRPGKALEYCASSLALQEEYDDKRAQASTLDSIADIHRSKGEYGAAVEVLRRAIVLATEIEANGELQEIHHTLSKTYAEMGRHEEAYRELKLSEEIKSRLFNEETSNMMAEMEARFEADRKDKENVILRQEQAITALELERLKTSRRALGAGLGLLVLVFFASHSLYRLRAERRHKTELELLVEKRTAELRHEKEAAEAAREKLRDLDRLKSELFANISHELRTPLTLTLGPLRDVRDGMYGEIEPAAVEQIDLARSNAERMVDLINQLLDLARLEAGRLKLRARRGDLIAFLHCLYKRFVPLAERRQVNFRFDPPRRAIELYFDPDQLDKVFMNLLANAFKFTPRNGAVSLSVTAPATSTSSKDEIGEEPKGWVTVRIRDTGSGISADELTNIFDRFYQVESSAARRWPGSGLGLALAKDLTELHGGLLEADSEIGFGSSFAVELPLGRDHLTDDQLTDEEALSAVPDDQQPPVTPPMMDLAETAIMPAEPAPTTEETDGDQNTEDRTTVLVVDDHPDVRTYIRNQLETDYRVEEAVDGEHGLELARKLMPDLVVSDVMMPGMNGFELCSALKENPELDYLPVILLTARAGPRNKLEGLRQGADDYLTKPFDARELKARIGNLIASRRRLQHHFDRGPALRPVNTEVVSADTSFLERVQDMVEEGMVDGDFNVDVLASRVGMDRSHLYRRLRALTHQTPSELIRTMRLERAEQLIRGNAGSISEIAYQVGFKSVAHFSKSFRDRYQASPSAYRDTCSARRTA